MDTIYNTYLEWHTFENRNRTNKYEPLGEKKFLSDFAEVVGEYFIAFPNTSTNDCELKNIKVYNCKILKKEQYDNNLGPSQKEINNILK